MRFQSELLFGAFLVVQAVPQSGNTSWVAWSGEPGAEVLETAPICSLPCFATFIPEFCGSLTNVTCLCTDDGLTAALLPCVFSACNITQTLQVGKYSAQVCGVANDKYRLNEQLHGYYVVPPLVTCIIAARIYIKVNIANGLGTDDWMMLAALASYLVEVSTGLVVALYGFGQHTFWLTPTQVTNALKWFYIGELIYVFTLTLTKLSLLLFFRRIFPDPKFRQATIAMMGFVILTNFALMITLCFQCRTVSGVWTNWMYEVPPIKCIPPYTGFIVAGFSILHDLIILVMPLPILWKLHLPWAKKVNLLVIFCVGSFVIICSLLRLPSLEKFNSTNDPSYEQAPIALWSNLELGVGIICGCLPSFGSVVGHLFSQLKMNTKIISGNTPAYNRSPSNRKPDRKDRKGSTRTLIELDNRSSSQEELERGPMEGAFVLSHIIETPIRENRMPSNDKNGNRGYGNFAAVDVGNMDDQRQDSTTLNRGNIIVMTTVDQWMAPPDRQL